MVTGDMESICTTGTTALTEPGTWRRCTSAGAMGSAKGTGE